MHTNPEVLALLALGEDSGSLSDRAHVETCPTCARELAELAHLAGVGRAVEDAAPLERPSPEVWERIRAELGFTLPNDRAAVPPISTPTPAPTSESAPPVRSGSDPVSTSSRRGRRVLALALAAALALIVGIGIGLGWDRAFRPSPTVLGEGQLTAGARIWQGASGQAMLERNAAGQQILVVRMTTPRPVPGIRQVWLMDRSHSSLIPVGIITGDEGQWTVPADIQTEFPVVDVSEEPVDGNLAHSGVTIVRGTLST